MTALSNSRIAWFNGEFMPEGQVMIPFRDRSWKYGDGAFDMTRTFDGRPFRLKEHIDRFYRSLRYLRIDPGVSPGKMIELSEEVVARNEHLRPSIGDWWVGQRVSRGVDAVGDEGWKHTGPNVVIEVLPLPLKKRAQVLPRRRRCDGDGDAPHVAQHAQPARQDAQLPQHDRRRDAGEGRRSRCLGDPAGRERQPGRGHGQQHLHRARRRLLTPRQNYVLPGVSRQMTIDLAAKLGIPCEEQDLDMFDAETADEMFLTSTSLCILPVRSFNGGKVGDGQIPGSVTARLMAAYSQEVGCDFVRQYLDRLE